jgi:hypothetical protein
MPHHRQRSVIIADATMVVNTGWEESIPEWLDGLEADFYTWGTGVKALPRCEVLLIAAANKLEQGKRLWRMTSRWRVRGGPWGFSS